MTKGLLLHVAADSTNLGISGPIFDNQNNKFKFIPIFESNRPGEKASSEIRTYGSLGLAPYVQEEAEDWIVHYDPDLENFTHSEPLGRIRGKELEKLDPGDYLLFVASLVRYSKDFYQTRTERFIKSKQQGKMAKYLVGYYKIFNVFNIRWDGNQEQITSKVGEKVSVPDSILARMKKNAHYRRPKGNFTCAVGDPEGRKNILLKGAVRLTERGSPFSPSPEGRRIYGNRNYPRGFKRIGQEQVLAALTLCKDA